MPFQHSWWKDQQFLAKLFLGNLFQYQILHCNASLISSSCPEYPTYHWSTLLTCSIVQTFLWRKLILKTISAKSSWTFYSNIELTNCTFNNSELTKQNINNNLIRIFLTMVFQLCFCRIPLKFFFWLFSRLFTIMRSFNFLFPSQK